MEDFRLLDNNNMWIWIIIIFLLFCGCGSGCGNGLLGGSECGVGNLFGGCNNNIWTWIIILIILYWLFCSNSCGGGIFRNDIQ